MKKVFKLTDPKKHEDRVLDGIKNEIRKYVKREKKKDLTDKKLMYWDFDCKIGATAEDAKGLVYEELIKAIDALKATGLKGVYVEILAKEVLKPLKEEHSTEENDTTEES